MPKSLVIALTGATGFVGRHVCEKLLEKGYQVRALVRPGSLAKAHQSENLIWVEGALGDALSEEKLCRGADIVIHMAGLVTARTRAEYYRVNADAVGTLAKTAMNAGVRRFVYLSSLAAKKPELSHYAGSKKAGESALKGVNSVIVRAPAVFGPGDKATAPFYALIKKGFLPVPGGKKWRSRQLSLIHVNDLADYLTGACLVDDLGANPVYIATRASITWPEFAEECTRATGHKVRVLPLPVALLYAVALIQSVTKRVFGAGHLTLGKLREFLYEDWSVPGDCQTGSSLQSALKATISKV